MAGETQLMVQRTVRPSRQPRGSRSVRLIALAAPLALTALGTSSCSPGGIADEGKLPPNIQDPSTLHTPNSAVARYFGALTILPETFDWFMTGTAILTDELAALPTPLSVTGTYTALDSRQDLSGFTDDYNRLHRLRAQAREARGFLEAYAPDSQFAWSAPRRGHLYALEAMADVWLADLFCSGIPLSTVDFNGDYTLAAGSTTTEVYRQAAALFDSALALVGDSVQFRQLAAIGRGRALLALGQYAAAAAAVSAVPDDYRYDVLFDPPVTNGVPQRLLWQFAEDYPRKQGTPAVADQEGLQGLPYRSGGDPRVLIDTLGSDILNHTMYFPAKYPTTGAVTLTLASGIEARLIEGEAGLHAGDVAGWLAKLNQLRTAGGVDVPADTIADTLGVTDCGPALCGTSPGGSDPSMGQPPGGFHPPAGYSLVDSFTINPVSQEIYNDCWANSWYEPCYTDFNAPQPGRTTVYVYTAPPRTYWPAGTGGVEGLPALDDPGTPEARVDLLFRERAFWLYLTGHREGDLRRMVREYGRAPDAVYPTGAYQGGSGTYGTEIVAPVPESERTLNSKYTGCVNRGA